MASSLKPPKPLVLTGNLSQNWRTFRQEFELYLTASGQRKRKSGEKVALLLHIIGADSREVYYTLGSTGTEDESEGEETLETLYDKFEKYCNPKKNILHARSLFYSRNQKVGESFDSFYNDLKKLAKDSEFENIKSSLRDRLVFGSNDTVIQAKLIKAGDVSLEDTVERLRIAEITRRQTSEALAKPQEVAAVEAQKPVYRKSYPKSPKPGTKYQPKTQTPDQQSHATGELKKIDCKWCGKQHVRDKSLCPAQGKTCTRCKKLNHLAEVCRSKQVAEVRVEPSSASSSQNSDFEEYYCSDVSLIETISARAPIQCSAESVALSNTGWLHSLKVNNIVINFKLDTGACVNILPMYLFKKMCVQEAKLGHPEIRLNKEMCNLKAYNNTPIEINGSTVLKEKREMYCPVSCRPLAAKNATSQCVRIVIVVHMSRSDHVRFV
ncbi:uncharacterized protein [Bemisia tabaci]|uniref:uncharacterized protein n=1 Tax=Bemisia tabaci TaxID=7038 RepID=UPI003B28CDCE